MEVLANIAQRSRPMVLAIREDTRNTPQSMQSAEQSFRQAYPAFECTSDLDHLRATDYSRLDALGHMYFDYTGGGLYAESQLRDHLELLRHNVFGNPHSQKPTSRATTELAERA